MRPSADESAPYYHRYISLVESSDVVATLAEQLPRSVEIVRALRPGHRYAPDKWSVKQVVGHLVDTERVMGYRALRISRGDATELPGFDQDVMVNGGRFDELPIEELLAEWAAVRQATLYQFRAMSEPMWSRRGAASGHPVTARALAYIIAGHEIYHARLFLERYR
jgi:hypothetical protein